MITLNDLHSLSKTKGKKLLSDIISRANRRKVVFKKRKGKITKSWNISI